MNLFVLFGHPPSMMDAISATIYDGGQAIHRSNTIKLITLILTPTGCAPFGDGPHVVPPHPHAHRNGHGLGMCYLPGNLSIKM
jgi:hypothetical protein